MKFAANYCRRSAHKNHRCTDTYSRLVYSIRYWRLRCKMIDNINTLNDPSQTLEFFMAKSRLYINHTHPSSVEICIRGIEKARLSIKKEIHRQTNLKEKYKYDLASDIIDRHYRYLFPEHSISDKFQHEDLIDNKLKQMKEAKAKINLFTMLRFDIKGFIDPHSIKCNSLTSVDVLVDGLDTRRFFLAPTSRSQCLYSTVPPSQSLSRHSRRQNN
jgi:hypothetical protein